MSYTTTVINELLSLPLGKTCCRKALLCGLLYSGCEIGEGRYRASFISNEGRQLAAMLLRSVFSVTADESELSFGAKKIYLLEFYSKSFVSIIHTLEGREGKIEGAVGFRCADCLGSFLRGLFISSLSITDPVKNYHLEISLESEKRADALAELLEENIGKAGRVLRNGKIRLYYKKNASISDALYFAGAAYAGHEVANIYIEKTVINKENRATNCVAKNISRAVEASRKHIEAIEFIEKKHKTEFMSPELQYTAKLRYENPSASLGELALLHEPPISKSGLNARLGKILDIAKEYGNN